MLVGFGGERGGGFGGFGGGRGFGGEEGGGLNIGRLIGGLLG